MNPHIRSLGRRAGWILVLFTALLSAAPSIGVGPVYDDSLIVNQNPLAHRPIRWRELFHSGYWPGKGDQEWNTYRPLLILSFALIDPFGLQGQRVANALLHAGVSLLVLAVLLKLIPVPGLALWAAVLFSTHPVHSEVLGTLTGRGELLSTCLIMGCCYLHLKEKPFLAAFSGISAFLVKENAVYFPAIPFLFDLFRRQALLRLRSHAILLGGLVVALVFRLWAFGSFLGNQAIQVIDNPLAGLSSHYRILSALGSFWDAVKLGFFPVNLLLDRTSVAALITSLWDIRWIPFFLILTAMMIALVRAPVIALGLALFLVTYTPVSNLFFIIGTSLAERLLYVPSIGFCLILAWLIVHVRKPLAGVALAVLFLCGTWVNLWPYRDTLVLWRHTLDRVPSSHKSRSNLADALCEAGLAAEAIRVLEEGVKLDPDYPDYWRGLAIAYGQEGNRKEAIVKARRAFEMAPGIPKYALTLAGLLYDDGELMEARRIYEDVVKAWPLEDEAWWYLGRLREKFNEMDGAIEAWREAAQLYGPDSEWGKLAKEEALRLESLASPKQ